VRRFACVVSLAWLSLLLLAAAPPPARVESFSPSGVAKGARQVVARFSQAIVPFGDPRVSADAFSVSCAAKGRARWVTDREWVYDFEADLPAGLACHFVLKPGLRALGGAVVTGQRTFSFTTGGPAVIEARPWVGSEVAEDQRFVLRLDALPDAASLEGRVYALPIASPQPVPLRVVGGAERDAVLKSALYDKPRESDLVLEPVLKLPAGAIELVWAAGISANSVATTETQRFSFRVREPLTLRVQCTRVNADAGCIPLAAIRVSFSAPVAVAAAERAGLVPLGGGARVALVRADASDRSEFADAFVTSGALAPNARYRLELPRELRDDAGRALAPIDPERLTVATDAFPPLAKFAATFGIVEAADPLLPVTLRHIEPSALPRGASIALGGRAAAIAQPDPAQIWRWLHAAERSQGYRSPDASGRSLLAWVQAEAAPRALALPKTAAQQETEVVGIPLPGLGLHAVEIESEVLGAALIGARQKYHVGALALVTNLAVHFKHGRESSLVWVTTLDKAEPVAGANVVVSDCRGTELKRATTDASGIARIDTLPDLDSDEGCGWSTYERGLLVTAQKGADVSFVHTSWDRGIESWRFDVPTTWSAPGPIAHTVFDRALFRAGETVHMKHFLRKPALAGFALPEAGERPRELRITHLGSEDSYTLALAFGADGSAASEWGIPREAKLGTYQVAYVRDEGELAAGTFRVEQFRLPLMRGKLQGPQRAAIAGEPLPLDIALTYLSGGPASALPIELRTQSRPHAIGEVAGFEEHAFLRGDVREGVEQRAGSWWEEGGEASASAATPPPAKQLTLDAAGGARTSVETNASDTPEQVLAEVSYRDPNGELQTLARSVTVWPGDLLLGLRAAKHATNEQPLRVDVALLDLERRPVRGRVSVDLLQRKVFSYRKRLVGGYYAYEHAAETKRVAAICEGETDRTGKLACVAQEPVSGQLIVRARTRDAAGRALATYEEVWVPGADDDWYDASDSDRIDLVPEDRTLDPGDTARIRVRMPFRAATALVTLEREGVAEAFVTKLSGKDPRVSVRVLGAHAPNVFVSVLAVRGRVAAPAPSAQVDLARPASKLGMTELRVGLAARTLEVRVAPERESYRVRDKVRARVRVRLPNGKAPPAGSEVAIAVVDEALLELAPNNSWALLEAMHGRRAQSVRTYTAQQQVVGKRHFGLKARAAGGGGGASSTRELFDTLLLWKPRVALDARGEAQIEFALNDSLTSFRVAAIANGAHDHFGTGFGALRTTQDVMVLPGVAPVARAGDRVRPEFSVRNATERKQDVEVALTVSGAAQQFAPQRFLLAPGEARIAAWELAVPHGVRELGWRAVATRPGATGELDAVLVKQAVTTAVPERVLQAELVQLAAPLVRTVERPSDAIAGGGVDVTLRPTLASGTAGIDRFFREYPYGCLEQQTSSAIGLRDRARWDALMRALPAYLDGDGLAKFWPSGWLAGSDTLTAYLLAIAHEAGWRIPPDSFERMASGLEGFVDGRVLRPTYSAVVDLPLRRIAALEALSRYGRITPERLASVQIQQLELWPTSALLDYHSLLGRVPGLRDAAAKRANVERLLRARLTLGGATTAFSTERADLLDWMLATAETNVTRFALLAHGSSFDRELPRIVKGALARQRRGAWSTTVANAWGRLALEKFSARFERASVAGETTLALGAESERVAWTKPAPRPTQRLAWPQARAQLKLAHAGGGAPWAEIQSVAAVPLRQPLFAGYQVARTWTPLVQKTPGRWTRGDVVRVHLTIDAQSDFSWVVVDDPIPAGATILGSGLARDSALLTQGERSESDGWGCPCRAYTERTQLAYRDYFQYVPKGKVEIEYTLRLNQDGEFALPPTRVEAMYAPESFGELPHEPLRVWE
jgi:uncharacterized protein YfaS (alpha-2-macroglobulin family)